MYDTATLILLGSLMLGIPQPAIATVAYNGAEVAQQAKSVTGQVLDEAGEPVIGASVFEEGTKNGTVTDMDGKFTLSVKPNSKLIVSYIGFTSQTISVGTGGNVRVTLKAEENNLNEVVVTALGIKREKKALGYAMQEVNTASLSENQNFSVANMLQGKVAGVQITQSGAGMGGSTRIVMRGLNSLGGSNQPLWVVDGIPINDDSRGDVDQYGGSDYSGAASQINPEDIESISVLKGANAAALYGSRAQNGAIIVTTKSGQYNQPLTFEYNGNLDFASPYSSYEYQDVYGQGSGGNFNMRSQGSWGPKMEGQMIDSWRGTFYGDANAAQYAMKPGNMNFIDDFYRTGSMFNNSVVASAGSSDVRGRFSFTDSRNKGITPTHSLNRQYYSVNVEMKKKWVSVGAKGTYMHEVMRNNPGQGEFGIMSQFVKTPRSIRLSDLRDNILYNSQVINWTGPDPNASNPYGLVYSGNGNRNVRDRLMAQVSATLHFTDWLKLTGRTSIDWYADTYKNYATYLSSGSNTQNQYSHSRSTTKEFNADLLLAFNRHLGDFDVSANLGTSVYNRGNTGLSALAGLFQIPGFIYIGNGSSRQADESFNKKEIQSVYGNASVGYNSMLYLEVTGRNDWASTLPKSNRSYFYPSVSLSGIISEMVKMPKAIDYLKVRTSYAQVGNDTNPYQTLYAWSTYNSYVNGSLLEMQLPTIYPLMDLKPEKTNSFEVGFEFRMFENRLGIDFTYYSTRTTNQILSIQTASSSGFSNRMVNAGKIKSHGYELMGNGTPVENRDWKWDVTLNWGLNRTKCVRLTDQIKRYTLGETRVASVVVNEGGKFSDIVAGNAIKKNANGKWLIDDNGLPIKETDKVIGNMMPDWTGSIGNTLRWKDFSLTALVDILYGGDFISMTDAYATTAGNSVRSLEGRDGMVVPGIVESTGQANAKQVTAETYWNNVGGSSACAELFLYKRTNVKMRELSIGWNLPKAWLSNTPLASVKFSVVGRDLFYFYKDAPVAAESAFDRSDYAQAFEYASLPPTRSLGFSLNVKF